MKSVLNNKYVAALKNLMLFTAIIHMIIVTIYSAINLNLLKFNFFDILDLDLFFPDIITGSLNRILATGSAVIIYCLFLFFGIRKVRKE